MRRQEDREFKMILCHKASLKLEQLINQLIDYLTTSQDVSQASLELQNLLPQAFPLLELQVFATVPSSLLTEGFL